MMVFVASVSGITSAPRHAAYGAAKAGLMSLVRTGAVELGPAGIRVNAVAPGVVWTPRVSAFLGEEGRERNIANTPLRRVAQPADIAAALLFLASDLAAYVTGQTLVGRRWRGREVPVPDGRSVTARRRRRARSCAAARGRAPTRSRTRAPIPPISTGCPATPSASARLPVGVRLEFVGDAEVVELDYETRTDDFGYRGDGRGHRVHRRARRRGRRRAARPARPGDRRLDLDAIGGRTPDERGARLPPGGHAPDRADRSRAFGGAIEPAPANPAGSRTATRSPRAGSPPDRSARGRRSRVARTGSTS